MFGSGGDDDPLRILRKVLEQYGQRLIGVPIFGPREHDGRYGVRCQRGPREQREGRVRRGDHDVHVVGLDPACNASRAPRSLDAPGCTDGDPSHRRAPFADHRRRSEHQRASTACVKPAEHCSGEGRRRGRNRRKHRHHAGSAHDGNQRVDLGDRRSFPSQIVQAGGHRRRDLPRLEFQHGSLDCQGDEMGVAGRAR